MNDRFRKPHANDSEAGAPGASGPGDPAYDGNVTISTDSEAPTHGTPFGRPGEVPERPEDVPPELRQRLEDIDRAVAEHEG